MNTENNAPSLMPNDIELDTKDDLEIEVPYAGQKGEAKVEKKEPQEEVKAEDEDKVEEADTEEDKEETTEEETEGDKPLEDLGEVTEETMPAYEARYVKDGAMNEAIVSQEFWGNGQDEDGNWKGLHENTYEFLKKRFGVSKALAKQVEAAQVAYHEGKATARQQEVIKTIEEFGGVDAYSEALAWARAGGYNEKQQKKFNERIDGDDVEDQQDAILGLMNRFEKANPDKKNKGSVPRVKPVDLTKGKGVAPARPDTNLFESRQDYRKARDEAIRSGDPAQQKAVAEKLRRSQDAGKFL